MTGVIVPALAGIRFASWLEVVFAALVLLPLLLFAYFTFYLWRLLLAALPVRKRVAHLSPPDGTASISKTTGPAKSFAKNKQFAILIPAHNEELLLGAALDSLHGLAYPREAYRAIVIADNCTDRTAEIARAHGALALERFDTEKIGKGYALEWALERLLGAQQTGSAELASIAGFDAVVVLDADTQVAPNLLSAFEVALAAGQKAMQARYEVLNADESWRTRLMLCALALAHIIKPLGREQRKQSDGLKGNGMCFAREVVERVPWSGESITEDIEYTLRLCRAGYRVAFLPDTAVWAQMPTDGGQAATQRKRWEGGRYRLLFTVAPRLLAESLQKRDNILYDRAMELIIPPFAELFALPCLFLCLCSVSAVLLGWHAVGLIAWGWGAILALLAGYLALGLWGARIPAKVALSILRAPVYIVWKFGLYAVMAVGGSSAGWKRTERRKL